LQEYGGKLRVANQEVGGEVKASLTNFQQQWFPNYGMRTTS